MDIVSHALWGGVAFGKKTKKLFYWSLFFGALPDLMSFGVHTVAIILGFTNGVSWEAGPPPMSAIPEYVHVLYNISHSLVVFTLVALCLWFAYRTLFLPFMAYGFAVLVDIPTHSADFFPTPFLWPLSNYTFDGVSWGEPYIFFPNIILLVGAYMWWYWYTRNRGAKAQH